MAHTLKGVVANFEAEPAVSIARTLEHADCTSGLTASLMPQLHAELLKLDAALAAHQSGAG